MGWFFKNKKRNWEQAVIELLSNAMSIDLSANTKVFEGFPRNNIEAVVAIFWMVERSLSILPTSKREQSGAFMMDSLLTWFGGEYTPHEIQKLIIPCFKRRLDEYSRLFSTSTSTPTSAMTNTFGQIVTNVFGEDEPHFSMVAAAILFWWQPISEEGNRVAQLDKQGLIDWGASCL